MSNTRKTEERPTDDKVPSVRETLRRGVAGGMHRLSLLVALVTAMSLCRAASADTLKLSNGGELSGSIQAVTFLVEGAKTTYSRAQIKSLSTSATEKDRLLLKDESGTKTVKGELISVTFKCVGGDLVFERGTISKARVDGEAPPAPRQKQPTPEKRAEKRGDADTVFDSPDLDQRAEVEEDIGREVSKAVRGALRANSEVGRKYAALSQNMYRNEMSALKTKCGPEYSRAVKRVAELRRKVDDCVRGARSNIRRAYNERVSAARLKNLANMNRAAAQGAREQAARRDEEAAARGGRGRIIVGGSYLPPQYYENLALRNEHAADLAQIRAQAADAKAQLLRETAQSTHKVLLEAEARRAKLAGTIKGLVAGAAQNHRRTRQAIAAVWKANRQIILRGKLLSSEDVEKSYLHALAGVR